MVEGRAFVPCLPHVRTGFEQEYTAMLVNYLCKCDLCATISAKEITMADKARYPQIPSTVWWGVRAILQRTPKAVIDERLLGVQLEVQEAAARAYLGELKGVGLLNDDNKATDIAQKWRLDETYEEAVREILTNVYPEGLFDIAPPGEADRQKVISWFLREGLGQGSAGNKAATYLLISSPNPNEAPRFASKSQNSDAPRDVKDQSQQAAKKPRAKAAATPKPRGGEKKPSGNGSNELPPLNVNVQIHISADAGTDQIDSIFKAMRRYLYDHGDS